MTPPIISPKEAVSIALMLATANSAKRNVTVALIFESLKQTGWTIVRSKNDQIPSLD
jgi:hypothetical protein